MKPTQHLHNLGQSLWLDNLTRDILHDGTLKRYRDEYSLTGLTSNPTIFDTAITHSPAYDDDITRLVETGLRGEDLFAEIAVIDLQQAADLFSDVHQRTATVDGWVSLEVSPLLAYDVEKTVASAKELHRKANRPNLYIKIPGTPEGVTAIEESIYAGVPINVTLLFSAEQYLAAANAYMKGLERRVEAGLSPDVRSVASIFVSRWDKALMETAPPELRAKVGIAICHKAYKAYRDILDSNRWQRLENLGARAQRLLFASTGTKDPQASDVLYIDSLAAPNTINTMPDATLLAFSDHGEAKTVISRDGGEYDSVLSAAETAGIDLTKLALTLQEEGAKSFVKSWEDLMAAIESKSKALV